MSTRKVHVSCNLRVTSDPTDVGHASKLVIGMDIEDVLDGKRSAKKITGSCVYDTLWFTGGTGSLSEMVRLDTETEGQLRT
jgi:hypothetical protein